MLRKRKLPDNILNKAIKNGNEYGWKQSDFIEVVKTATQMQIAIIGGQVQYALHDGTCELYWLSYDPKSRYKDETWENYCQRTETECLEQSNEIISAVDIEKEAIDNFQFLKDKKQAGVNLNDYLIFILYFADEKIQRRCLWRSFCRPTT
jgi:hypothetical protein